MKIVCEYSHLGGSEILQVKYPELNKEIYEIIDEVIANKIKISEEKTKKGKSLYSPKDMNTQFKESFNKRDFEEKKDYFEIDICHKYNPPHKVKGYKQVDFVKDKVFVEVQFGKYAFMFYDMAKFQYFFNEEKADVGVEIVPCYDLQREMSSGVSYGDQLINDIKRLRRHFPAVPIKVILIDVDD